MNLLCAASVAAAIGAQPAAAARWLIQSVPRPPHSRDAGFNDVACTSRIDCVAVGGYDVRSSGEPVPLVEHWNGSRWSIEGTPPLRGRVGWFNAVSCPSGTACTAVGESYGDNVGEGLLAERWDGSAWSIQRMPVLDNGLRLYGISCASSTTCVAVGEESLAVVWNGKRWSVENIHFGDPQGRANALTDVSCPTRTTCAAVGSDDVGLCADPYYSDYDVPVLGFRALGRWSLKRHPNVACSNGKTRNGGDLNGVSCASTTACTAVGSAVYHWNGHQWSIQSAPVTGQLNAVDCTSSNACTAVGSQAYVWNGRRWSSVAVPRPAPATRLHLTGVSCTSRTSCVAVGYYEDRAGRTSLLVESTGAVARSARSGLSNVAAAGSAVATSAQRLSEPR